MFHEIFQRDRCCCCCFLRDPGVVSRGDEVTRAKIGAKNSQELVKVLETFARITVVRPGSQRMLCWRPFTSVLPLFVVLN